MKFEFWSELPLVLATLLNHENQSELSIRLINHERYLKGFNEKEENISNHCFKTSFICESISFSLKMLNISLSEIEGSLNTDLDCSEKTLYLLQISKLIISSCIEETIASSSLQKTNFFLGIKEITNKIHNKIISLFSKDDKKHSKNYCSYKNI